MNKIGLLAQIGSNLVPLGGIAQELIETVVNLTSAPPKKANGEAMTREEVLAEVAAAFGPIQEVKTRAELEIEKARGGS